VAHYLDCNATSPLRPVAREALFAAYDEVGNASSVHGAGRAARYRVEQARELIAGACGFAREDVVFTSGGSEANHLALKGVQAGSILASAIEHDSVLKNAPDAVRLPVLPSGVVDLERAAVLIAAAAKPALVSVMWVNNETGVIQPIAALLELCRAHGAFLHVDGVQALGRIPLAVQPDLLTLSAHKVGGPQGVGALLVREGVPVAAQIKGGGQERGRRAGTENVAGIAGFGAAVQAALDELPEYQQRSAWRDEFEALLLKIPGTRIIGAEAPRVANTTLAVRAGMKAETTLIKLDLMGIAASSGSACSSGKVARSHVLKAMAVSDAEADSAIRFSFAFNTQLNVLKKAAECWTNIATSDIR